jgi:hypothetical protein
MGEIKGEEGGIVSSVHISPADPGKPHDLVNVRSRGKSTGMLVVAAGDGVVLAARLLGPQAHEHTEAGSILDRCVSLVQSIANRRPRSGLVEASERLEVYEDEASLIAHDAGWK